MEGQRRVLQQRVEIIAIDRRIDQTPERVGGPEQQQQKADTKQSMHAESDIAQAQTARISLAVQTATTQGNRRAEDGEHHDPEQKRAFVITPAASDLVQQGLGGMAVLHHSDDREIRSQKQIDQPEKGSSDQPGLHPGGPARHGGCRLPTDRIMLYTITQQQQPGHCLYNSRGQCQHEGEMAQFGNHQRLPSISVSVRCCGP